MKTLVLMVALASCEVQEIRDVPAAAVSAAPVVQEVAGIRSERSASAPSVAVLAEPGEARAASSSAHEVAEVAEAAGGCFGQPVRIEAAMPSGTAIPARVEVFPFPASGEPGSIAAMYAQRRLLSGPGTVLRRLKAARSRGDLEEARRMEAKMDELIAEAVMQEGDL